MEASDWVALAVLIFVLGLALVLMLYSVSLQKSATARMLGCQDESIRLSEQSTVRIEESLRLQREANDLLRDISQKLDRDQRG